jgi:hypothetical protein
MALTGRMQQRVLQFLFTGWQKGNLAKKKAARLARGLKF